MYLGLAGTMQHVIRHAGVENPIVVPISLAQAYLARHLPLCTVDTKHKDHISLLMSQEHVLVGPIVIGLNELFQTSVRLDGFVPR